MSSPGHSPDAAARDAVRVRKIVHVDMDAFYAAVEQRDDPSLRGLPVAVGGSGPRGVVMTASYEARAHGVRSAMPTGRARRLCPDLLVVRARFPAYKEASAIIREVMLGWTPLVEPLSLDEAYLDVTEAASGTLTARAIASSIKAEIRHRTGLVASAGVSFNKLLAKLASDQEKPDGLTVIRPHEAVAFLAGLPVRRLHGVGPATARRLEEAGLVLGRDLQSADPSLLAARFGRLGPVLQAMAWGRDDRPVSIERQRRSLSVEETLDEDLTAPAAMREVIRALAIELVARSRRACFPGRTLTLKIKTADFRLRTRSITPDRLPLEAELLADLATELLRRPPVPVQPVRLLGLGLHGEAGAASEPAQLSLLDGL